MARYCEHGAAGMADRSSQPRTSPHCTPVHAERRIVRLRVSKRLGPARIAFRLGLNPSTVHRVLARATGRRVRRYERARPGELLDVDVKKLGNIPDGGGHRIHGRRAGKRNSQATTGGHGRHPLLDYGYLHTALDDHSRRAYTEILPDERKDTAAASLTRTAVWYAIAGITIQRVLGAAERLLAGNG